MKLTNFSVEKVANLSLHHLIQQSLPGKIKMLEGLKAHALLSLPPQPDRAERLGNRAIDDEDALVVEPGSRVCAIAMTSSSLLPWPPPAAMPQSWPSLSAASTALAALTTATLTMEANKWKSWDHTYYAKKKRCLLNFEPDAAAATTTTIATADSACHR